MQSGARLTEGVLANKDSPRGQTNAIGDGSTSFETIIHCTGAGSRHQVVRSHTGDVRVREGVCLHVLYAPILPRALACGEGAEKVKGDETKRRRE